MSIQIQVFHFRNGFLSCSVGFCFSGIFSRYLALSTYPPMLFSPCICSVLLCSVHLCVTVCTRSIGRVCRWLSERPRSYPPSRAWWIRITHTHNPIYIYMAISCFGFFFLGCYFIHGPTLPRRPVAVTPIQNANFFFLFLVACCWCFAHNYFMFCLACRDRTAQTFI